MRTDTRTRVLPNFCWARGTGRRAAAAGSAGIRLALGTNEIRITRPCRTRAAAGVLSADFDGCSCGGESLLA
eukprot:scaffold2314_cov267-Pinguiococcus_pyrenoidosus.AAC.15